MKLGLIEGQSYDCFDIEISQHLNRGNSIENSRSHEHSENYNNKENEHSQVGQSKNICFDRTKLSSFKKSLMENYWQLNWIFNFIKTHLIYLVLV